MTRLQNFCLSLFLGAAAATLSSCSLLFTPPLRVQIANSGPIAVRPDNDALAVTRLLVDEASKSLLLRRFLEKRGLPDAVEIRKLYFEPYRIYLYYLSKNNPLEQNETYVAEDGAEDWIIRGPEEIPAETQTALRNLSPLADRDATALLSPTEIHNSSQLTETKLPPGDDMVDAFANEALPNQPEIISARAGLDNTGPVDEPRRAPAAQAPYDKSLAFGDSPARSKNQRASESDDNSSPNELSQTGEPNTMSTSSVEEPVSTLMAAENGDLLHQVTFPGETLRIIASWYAGDPGSATRLARINDIQNPDLMSIGQMVRIPRYLVKRRVALPAIEIERYAERLHSQ
jgi:hypothetical protein